MLFDAVRENFDLSTCREYTVEAGRPDTITEEKLLAIKNGGAGRISINPQTFSDEVLKKYRQASFCKAYEGEIP